METNAEHLTPKQRHLVTISALTATSNVAYLKVALASALEAGLTINEINEELAHLYAYCGFAASVRGTNLFREVVEERRAQRIQDSQGREATPITDTASKYVRGEQNQVVVTGMSPQQLTAAFSFNPVLDRFLKEHLFADLFGSDVLSFLERELVTVAALTSMQEPLALPHYQGALNVGVSEAQLRELLVLVEDTVGAQAATTGRQILESVLAALGVHVPQGVLQNMNTLG
ncbi:carboxymuconolactone decarboxylase family protein [Hymenobacter seoulensis]